MISVENLPSPMKVTVMTRYNQAETPATICMLAGSIFMLNLMSRNAPSLPDRSSFFYDRDIVVGGTIIE